MMAVKECLCERNNSPGITTVKKKRDVVQGMGHVELGTCFQESIFKDSWEEPVERERLGCGNNGEKVLQDIGDSSQGTEQSQLWSKEGAKAGGLA